MITAADLRPLVGVDPSDASHDTRLTALEAAVVQFLERQTGRFFGNVGTADTVILEGMGSRYLYLPDAVTAITTVTEARYPGDPDAEVLASSEYELRGLELVRTGSCGRWYGRHEYTVALVKGRPVSDMPQVREGVVAGVRYLWGYEASDEGAAASPGMKSESIDNYSYTRVDTLVQESAGALAALPEILDVISSWRIWRA